MNRAILLAALAALLTGCDDRPRVQSVSPVAGTTGLSRRTAIVAAFDRPVLPSSVAAGTSVFLHGGGGEVAGRVVLYAGDRSLLFLPSADLAPNTEYRFTLLQTIVDPQGHPLDAAFAVTFVTGPDAGKFERLGWETRRGRFFQTASALPDGRVLVVGGTELDPGAGVPPFPLSEAEILDLRAGTSTSVPQTSMRIRHTATTLADGRILIASGELAGATEVFDPATGRFTAGGTLVTARMGHTATRLPSGRVLLVGGLRPELQGFNYRLVPLDSAEEYDPASGSSTAVGSLSTTRFGHAATLLPDGRVVVAGGTSRADVEIYDARTRTFATSGRLLEAREDLQGTLLASGQVLFVGGSDPQGRSLASSEVYDPATGASRATRGAMAAGREDHTATTLADGRVLVCGGEDNEAAPGGGDVVLSSAELYDPATDSFSSAGSFTVPRDDHAAVRLADGRVLLLGGEDSEGRGMPTAELFRP